MFEVTRKSKHVPHAWSESRVELNESPPVTPPATETRVRTKKKRRKQQQQQQQQQHSEEGEKRSDSAQERCKTPSVHGKYEREERPSSGTESMLRGIFQIGKKSHDVILTGTRLTWTRIQPESLTGDSSQKNWQEDFVELKDVFAVKVKRRRSAGQQIGGTLLGITLFICKGKGAKLKHHEIHLDNMSVDHCEIWFKHIKEILNSFKHHPKSLKVFVNPTSHKKDAYQIYQDQVAPLFKLADIQVDVTVTERKGHVLSILKECSLHQYDGVVCVGGDGSVAEVAHGLLLRAQTEAKRDTHSDFKPVPAPLPLGVIPAGSADVVACSVHGIRHPVTAALHIIMGHRQQVDMCSVSSMGALQRFGFCTMVGFGGRVLAAAEKLHWVPPSQRNEVAFITALTQLRLEDCEISFVAGSSGASDQTQSHSVEDLNGIGEDVEWQVCTGSFLSVGIMSIPCLCSVALRGLAPFTRLNNNRMALIMVANTSRSEFVKHLKRYSSSKNPFSFSFVDVQSVREVKLRPHSCTDKESMDSDSRHTSVIPSEATLTWNIDGELLEIQGEVLIRVHDGLLTVFGIDVQEAEEPPVNCSCI
ncbi:ceramide kinase-like protein [Trichomycterus rosablanca]|uniref:ceramide kinase-like protein n=1 Tax=Trichomycterus rosablanca TaxID=2290929 RepID=UPI002F35660B